MTEFQRIESMRRAYDALAIELVRTDNEISIGVLACRTPQVDGDRDVRYQQCGGGRRVLRKRIGD